MNEISLNFSANSARRAIGEIRRYLSPGGPLPLSGGRVRAADHRAPWRRNALVQRGIDDEVGDGIFRFDDQDGFRPVVAGLRGCRGCPG